MYGYECFEKILGSRLITWASRCLIGNIALAEFIVGIPSLTMFIYQGFLSKEFGYDYLMRALLVCSLQGAVMGLLIWFTVARPALSSKGRHVSIKKDNH